MKQLELFEYYTPPNKRVSPQSMVTEFHKAFGLSVAEAEWSDKTLRLREELIREEALEVEDAILSVINNPYLGCEEALLKELADLVYVVYGTAVSLGLNLDEALERVHESNMSKLGEDGKPIYRPDGKVLKSVNYRPPYLGDLV